MIALRLAAVAAIYAMQRGSEALGRVVGVDAYRALTDDPRPWALSPPQRRDESPCLWIDDGERVDCEGDVLDVLRCGPVVLCADWCPDGRGRWIVLRADQERGDGEAMAARWKAMMDAPLVEGRGR